MEKLFTVLVSMVLLASCGQTETGKTDKTVSDTTLTQSTETTTDAKTGIKTENMVAEPAGSKTRDIPGIDAILILESEANDKIQRYHKSIGLKNNNNQNVSFMLDANLLRAYLDQNTNISKLDVYLAQESDGKMTLVYVGGKDSSGYVVEVPYYKPNQTAKYVFDHAMPCPTCARIGIHTPPSTN